MELTANVIEESMFAQCDADGNDNLLLDSLIDYHKDDKVIFSTDQQISIQDRPVTYRSTAALKICCQWKDGSTSWEKFSDLKESHLVQKADVSVSQGIDHAFNC